MRRENANLLKEMEDRIGQDSSVEREKGALEALEPRVRDFMQRGAATGVFVEEIPERTACQVLLDYWSSTLSHAGMPTARPRLAPFDPAKLPDLKDKGCPYVGLDAFREPTFFFGREKAIETLLDRLADVQLVIVQGASGSGKSSLAIAGALPALASGKRLPPFRVIGSFAPGNAPFENLVGALAAAMPDRTLDRPALAATLRESPDKIVTLVGAEAPPIAIVVDQFEEIFTLCSDTDRGAFVALISAFLKARRQDRVLLTLREEFSGEMDRLEPLAPLLAQHFRFSMQEWRMGYAELRAAIERPAALVNLHFSPGIVDDLVKRVVGLDAALPLLQFALKALWNARDHNRITREVYERIGGSPLVALERYADGLYGALTPELQVEVRRILLELVRIGRLLEPYRQPLLRSELLGTGSPRAPEALKQLEIGELVRVTPTADCRDAIVDVAHEALLRNWTLYARWIEDKREQERERIAIKDAAARWAGEHQRSRSEGLLSPWQLVDAKRLAGLNDDPLVRDYLQVCADAADAERRRQIRRSAIRSAVGILLLFLIVGLVGVSVLAWRERTLRGVRNAETEIYRATGESHQGQIGRALPDALKAASDASALLVETWPQWLTNFWADRPPLRGQLRGMLLSVLRETSNLHRVFVRDGVVFRAVAFRPGPTDDSNARLAFGGSDGKIYLGTAGAWPDSGKPLPLPLDGCAPFPVTTLAFDPAGHWLVAGCANGALKLWSAEDWKRRSEYQPFRTRVTSLAVSRDGRLVAAGATPATDKNGVACCSVTLRSLNDAGEIGDEQKMTWQGGHPRGGVWAVAFSPKEDRLLVGEGSNGLSICKPDVSGSWTCSTTQGGSEDDAILALAYAPDGARAAVGHWRGSVEVWDADLLEAIFLNVNQQPPKPKSIQVVDWYSPVYAVGFFDGCGVTQLAIAKGTGLQYWPLSGSVGACAMPRRSPIGDWVDSVAFDPASGLLATASGNGYIAILDPAGDVLRTEAQKADLPAPVRGALVAEEGKTAWVATPVAPVTNNGANLALFKLRDGAVLGGGPAETVVVGSGKILRLSASPHARLLAALNGENAADCPDVDESREIDVWRMELRDETPKLGAQIASLKPADFTKEAERLTPCRIALSSDGRWLAVSFRQPGDVLVVRLEDGLHRLVPDADGVREIAFSWDGAYFAAGGCPDGNCTAGADRVQVWRVGLDDFKVWDHSPLTLTPLTNRIAELGFAANRKGKLQLLAGGQFGAIDRWDAGDGKWIETLRGDPQRTVEQIAFSERAALVATANANNAVQVWDTSQPSWRPFQLTPETDDPQRKWGFVAFGGDGAWLASGGEALRVRDRNRTYRDIVNFNDNRQALQIWDLDVNSLRRKLCSLLVEGQQSGGWKAPSCE